MRAERVQLRVVARDERGPLRTYGNVVRWIPPLVVSEAQINDGLTRFEEAIDAIFED